MAVAWYTAHWESSPNRLVHSTTAFQWSLRLSPWAALAALLSSESFITALAAGQAETIARQNLLAKAHCYRGFVHPGIRAR